MRARRKNIPPRLRPLTKKKPESKVHKNQQESDAKRISELQAQNIELENIIKNLQQQNQYLTEIVKSKTDSKLVSPEINLQKSFSPAITRRIPHQFIAMEELPQSGQMVCLTLDSIEVWDFSTDESASKPLWRRDVPCRFRKVKVCSASSRIVAISDDDRVHIFTRDQNDSSKFSEVICGKTAMDFILDPIGMLSLMYIDRTLQAWDLMSEDPVFLTQPILFDICKSGFSHLMCSDRLIIAEFRSSVSNEKTIHAHTFPNTPLYSIKVNNFVHAEFIGNGFIMLKSRLDDNVFIWDPYQGVVFPFPIQLTELSNLVFCAALADRNCILIGLFAAPHHTEIYLYDRSQELAHKLGTVGLIKACHQNAAGQITFVIENPDGSFQLVINESAHLKKMARAMIGNELQFYPQFPRSLIADYVGMNFTFSNNHFAMWKRPQEPVQPAALESKRNCLIPG